MSWFPRKLGWLLLAYLAVLGYALVAWLPSIIDTYQRTAENSPWLGNLYLAAVALGGLILLGISLYLLGRMWKNSLTKQKSRQRRAKNPSELSVEERRAELDANLARSDQFREDAAADAALRDQLKADMESLAAKRENQKLEIVAFGTISSGKSSLLNSLAGREVFSSNVIGGTTSARSEIPWPGSDSVILVDTPGLAEVKGEARAAVAAEAANTADLVLLVVDGPLKAYEVELVDVLVAMEKRLLVCLNKEDWYGEVEQAELLGQIAEQLPTIKPEDVVAVRAAEVMRPQVRVKPDGSEETQYVPVPPDVQPLARRMLKVVTQDGTDLLLANLLLQSRGLVDEAKDKVRAELDKRADKIITKYMWAAGGAAGINPFPLLDLAGGSAITMKMVLDLAKVYRQKLDVDMATKMLEQLGKNLIAMLGATVASPAVASAIGSMLKTVPGIGTIAGGLVQGVTQALVTRWIGMVFVEYFRNEMKPPGGGLAEIARDKWEELTRPQNLRKMIQLGREEIDEEEDIL